MTSILHAASAVCSDSAWQRLYPPAVPRKLGICVPSMMRRYAQFAWYAVPAALLLALSYPRLIDEGSIRSNDAAAIACLRSINETQKHYAAEHPGEGFACRLTDLNRQAEYSGYRFTLTCPETSSGTVPHYEAVAEPLLLATRVCAHIVRHRPESFGSTRVRQVGHA